MAPEEPIRAEEPQPTGPTRTKRFRLGTSVFAVRFLGLRWLLARDDDERAD